LSVIAAALLLGLVTPAHAQVGVSAQVQSDYRFRGVSLSDGDPVASVSVSYDHASGAYGGLTGVGVATDHSGVRVLGYVAYLGYAGRLKHDTSWDAGVTNSNATVYLDKKYSSNYTELYAGLTRDDVSVHVYYSPRYFLYDGSTLYVDVNGAFRPVSHWRLFGHIGVLSRISPVSSPNADHTRFDLRAGVAREFRHFELNLAWTTTGSAPVYPPGYPQSRDAVVAAAVFFF
jgi:uncharacterized protein (TIGR02001 family)